MKKSEWKAALFEVLSMPVDGASHDAKMRLLEKYVTEYQQKCDEKREKPNYRRPWTDDELRIVLQDAPTASSCAKYARIFGRGYGSIEQIYRWASTSDKEVKRKRPNDAFVAHIKRIAKELGWRA